MKPHAIQTQKGAALIVGMIVLLVMTLIGVSSLNMTTTELKMAGNLQAYDVSFQAADAIIQQTIWVRESAIDWTSVSATETYTALNESDEAVASATADLTYIDCRQNIKGYSLTMAETLKGVVHSLVAVGHALDGSGNEIGTATQEIGIETVRPGCPVSP